VGSSDIKRVRVANGNACPPPKPEKPADRLHVVVTTSEQHLDRKLKLALALIRFINAEIPSVIQVAGRDGSG
jgi:hypothetical protein